MAYRFIWDPRKAETNRAKHIVDFADAQRVFDDPCAFDWVDSREDYGEVRYCALGIVEGHLLFVTFTMPDETTIRIITARRAMPNEKRRYHEGQA